MEELMEEAMDQPIGVPMASPEEIREMMQSTMVGVDIGTDDRFAMTCSADPSKPRVAVVTGGPALARQLTGKLLRSMDLLGMVAVMESAMVSGSAWGRLGLDDLGGFNLWRDPFRRIHKKRSNQSEAYHRRIQKKWDKRYGASDGWMAWN